MINVHVFLATLQFTILMVFTNHLEDCVSHKNTQYQKVCVYLKSFVYISRNFSLSRALEIYGRLVAIFFEANLT